MHLSSSPHSNGTVKWNIEMENIHTTGTTLIGDLVLGTSFLAVAVHRCVFAAAAFCFFGADTFGAGGATAAFLG